MAATKIKVIELAKELGVTSKDLVVALEGMGHKGMRAMSPLPAPTPAKISPLTNPRSCIGTQRATHWLAAG